MSRFSRLNSTIWSRSEKWRKLQATLPSDYCCPRSLYFYLHTTPQANSCLCYRLPDMYGASDLNVTLKAYREAMQSLCKVYLVVQDPAVEVVYLVNAIRQDPPTNPKHAVGMVRVLDELDDCEPKSLCFQELSECEQFQVLPTWKSVTKDCLKAIERLSKGNLTPTPSPSPTTTTEGGTREDARPQEPEPLKPEGQEGQRPGGPPQGGTLDLIPDGINGNQETPREETHIGHQACDLWRELKLPVPMHFNWLECEAAISRVPAEFTDEMILAAIRKIATTPSIRHIKSPMQLAGKAQSGAWFIEVVLTWEQDRAGATAKPNGNGHHKPTGPPRTSAAIVETYSRDLKDWQ